MELDKAIELLKNYVKTDRVMRNYSVVADHDKLREERCIAIDTVLKELNKKKCSHPTEKKPLLGRLLNGNK